MSLARSMDLAPINKHDQNKGPINFPYMHGAHFQFTMCVSSCMHGAHFQFPIRESASPSIYIHGSYSGQFPMLLVRRPRVNNRAHSSNAHAKLISSCAQGTPHRQTRPAHALGVSVQISSSSARSTIRLAPIAPSDFSSGSGPQL